MPTLVIVPSRDPPGQQEIGKTVARGISGARLVEVDSDHHLTLREPDRVTRILEQFLVEAGPSR